MPQKKKNASEKWEIAKPILLKCYLNGEVTDSMMPMDVWKMRPEFTAVPIDNFRNNFRRLKNTVKEHMARAVEDEAMFRNDMKYVTLAKDLEGHWDGSDAQRLLKIDIEDGVHTRLKPKHFWSTRPEYQKFSLEKFRGHIHQELRSKRETNYWLAQRKKSKDIQKMMSDCRRGLI